MYVRLGELPATLPLATPGSPDYSSMLRPLGIQDVQSGLLAPIPYDQIQTIMPQSQAPSISLPVISQPPIYAPPVAPNYQTAAAVPSVPAATSPSLIDQARTWFSTGNNDMIALAVLVGVAFAVANKKKRRR